MLHTQLADAIFWQFLWRLDEDLAAVWRPATLEHVLDLDGHRCNVVDLAARCTSSASAVAALAADPATSAIDEATTDVDAVEFGSVE